MRVIITVILVFGIALTIGALIAIIVTVTTKPATESNHQQNGPNSPKIAHMKQDQISKCDSNPCKNGGKCSVVPGGYNCACPKGFKGKQCQIKKSECESNPCKNGAACLDFGDDYRCHCLHGFTGKQCEKDMDECASNPCQNNATCIDQVAGYRCQCIPGYAGSRCENAPYKAEVRVKMDFKEEMKKKGSYVYNQTIELLKPLIDAACKIFPICNVKGFRPGSVVINLEVQTAKTTKQITDGLKDAIKDTGFKNAEVGNIKKQEVNGEWSSWASWICGVTCGSGTQTRHRVCKNLVSGSGKAKCFGDAMEQSPCYALPCAEPVGGNWSSWSNWTPCSRPCGVGTQTRSRECNNPSPSNGGTTCKGRSEKTRSCFQEQCPGVEDQICEPMPMIPLCPDKHHHVARGND